MLLPGQAEYRCREQDVQEIDHLIGTMLDYARLDHPDKEMNWQLAPVAEWQWQSADKCRVQSHELQVENDLVSETFRVDPHLMELALSNLLVNACRYARKTVRLNTASRSVAGIPAPSSSTVHCHGQGGC